MKEEVLKEGRGPRVQRSRGPKVPGTKISQSLNMSLTLKKVHFVVLLKFGILFTISLGREGI